MWLVSTSLIAMQKSSHDLCVSLTFWHMMSGNSSHTFQIKFDPAFIFACRARLQAFSANVTCGVVPTTYIINLRHLPAQRFVYCLRNYDMKCFILAWRCFIHDFYFIAISFLFHCYFIAVSFSPEGKSHCYFIAISLLYHSYFIPF